MNELAMEAAKALIWVTIGTIPGFIGALVIMWSDIRSLKKAANAAFKAIRELKGEKCSETRE